MLAPIDPLSIPVSYLYQGLIWLLLFWLALIGVGYSNLAALILSLFGGAAGAIISVWWQQPAGDLVITRRTFDRVERAPMPFSYETLESSRAKRLARRRRQSSWLNRWLTVRPR